MTHLLQGVMTAIIATCISSLVTYFITSITYTTIVKKSLKESFLGYIKIHEKIYHQKELETYVEKKIIEHASVCPHGTTQLRIIKLLELLVRNSGVNTNDI